MAAYGIRVMTKDGMGTTIHGVFAMPNDNHYSGYWVRLDDKSKDKPGGVLFKADEVRIVSLG